LIVVAWLGCMAWLVRYEIAPERFGGTLRGYDALIGSDVLSRDTWMRVLQDGRPIGYSHHSLEVDEEAAASERITLQSTLSLATTLLGRKQVVRSQSAVYLDDWSRLMRFSFEATLGGVSVRAGGARRPSDGKFNVTITLGDMSQRTLVEIPDDVVLYAALGDTLARRLRPGRSVVVNTLDPLSMQRTPLTLEALREETLTVGTNSIPTVVVAARGIGTTITSWIDAGGDVVRAETPFGWTLERCTPEEAVAALP
jgi:hypothetical protein